MSRRSRELVDSDGADGSEPRERPSRTERKRASHDLRRLGEELLDLTPERLAALPLPERLREAVDEARRIKSFGARRRQAQFIGKLMRQLDDEAVGAIRSALSRA